MRAIAKTLIGMAAAVVCVSAAVILAPTTASAQDIGGMMRGFGVPVPYGIYRGPPARRSAPAASHKDTNKDSDEEESDSSSSKSSKNSDKNSSDKNSSDKNASDKNSADKNASDKSANADNKSRRQLSNAKDDGPAPSAPAPAAKAEPAKATVDDEPSFSPSR